MDMHSQKTQASSEDRPVIEVDFRTFQFPIYVDSRKGTVVDMQPIFDSLIGGKGWFEDFLDIAHNLQECIFFFSMHTEHSARTKDYDEVLFKLIELTKATTAIGHGRKFHLI
jgi:hypothetical protein